MHAHFSSARKWPLAIWLLVAGNSLADPLYITVPGEGWTLKLDTPAMTRTQATLEGRRYRYMTSSVETGITLSLHTETVGAGSHEECRDTYWSKSLAGPSKKSDINLSVGENVSYAVHLAEAVFQGTSHKSANGHAYFVKNGLCMDLHVSHWPYQPGSEKRVEAVLKSLAVVP